MEFSDFFDIIAQTETEDQMAKYGELNPLSK